MESWAEREDNVLDIEWNLNLSYLSFKRCSSSDKPTFCNVVFASKRWKSFFVWFSVDVHLHDDKGNDRRLVSQTNAGCIMMQAMNIFLTADKKKSEHRSSESVQICVSKDSPCLPSWWIGRNVNVWRIIRLEFLLVVTNTTYVSDRFLFYCVSPLYHFPVLYLKKRWFSLRTLIVNGSRPSIQTQGSPLLWLWSSFRNQPFCQLSWEIRNNAVQRRFESLTIEMWEARAGSKESGGQSRVKRIHRLWARFCVEPSGKDSEVWQQEKR